MQTFLLRALFILALSPLAAFGLTLDEAKQQGLVGEQLDGYLGVRAASAEVQKLAAEINQKRRENYQQIAKNNGTALQAVEALAGKKAIDKTQPGSYIKQADGSWVKK